MTGSGLQAYLIFDIRVLINNKTDMNSYINLFPQEDKNVSKRTEESDWSPESMSEVVVQLSQDFKFGRPTTEEFESHEDWKITNRRQIDIIDKSDGSSVQGEIIEAKYRGDKNFDQETVSGIVPREYQ